jgi:hypothetical protein
MKARRRLPPVRDETAQHADVELRDLSPAGRKAEAAKTPAYEVAPVDKTVAEPLALLARIQERLELCKRVLADGCYMKEGSLVVIDEEEASRWRSIMAISLGTEKKVLGTLRFRGVKDVPAALEAWRSQQQKKKQ